MATTKTELYNNGTLVATKTSAPFNTFDWTPASGEVGSASLTVKRYEDGVLVATSAAVGGTVDVAASYDSDYQAVLDYATANSIALPDQAQQDIDNQLLIDYKATGAWAKDDVFVKFKGTAPEAFKLIDWKRLTTMTKVGTVTFDANGAQGDGTTGYIKTGFNPAIDAVNMSQNNVGYMFGRTAASTTNKGGVFGVLSSGKNTQWTDEFSGNAYIHLNTGSGSTTAVRTQLLGVNGLYRDDSANYKVIDGTETTFAKSSVSFTNGEVYILTRNSNGSPSLYSDTKLSYFSIGASKSAEHAAIKTVLE
jgi:hypothetical protein